VNKIELTKSKKILLVIFGAILLMLVIWLVFRKAPVNVETAVAASGPMLVTIDAEGKTRFRDKVVVTAPISGKMSRIKVREGDLIPKEYVLSLIDPNPPTPRPPSETENLPNVHAVKIYAPITGRLLRILEKNDRIIQAGTPILEMGNPDAVEIVVDILSTDAPQVKPGSILLIKMENQPEPLKGRVRTIEPQAFTKVSALGVEEQRVNIIADFPSKGANFGDNFRVDVKIVIWEAENVLKIPSSALFREGIEWYVFTVEYRWAYRRKVVVGHQGAAETEILEGLSEGETVILHPPSQLTEGASVRSR
jgi:multidrug efflux pump subunit AcrA (membrane-fusion protein)